MIGLARTLWAISGTSGFGLLPGRSVELELEDLALPDVLDGGVAHGVEGVLHGLPLGIEDAVLEGDEDPNFHCARTLSKM